MATSNNPRKFSEKIALHNQKQAEETAAFEEVMKDLSITRAARVRRAVDTEEGGGEGGDVAVEEETRPTGELITRHPPPGQRGRRGRPPALGAGCPGLGIGRCWPRGGDRVQQACHRVPLHPGIYLPCVPITGQA